MTGESPPVVAWELCDYENQMMPVGHPCKGGGPPSCPTPEGNPCGTCPADLAAQVSDPRYVRPPFFLTFSRSLVEPLLYPRTENDMSHPYPSEPASTTLTPEAAGEYREMIAAAETRIAKLAPIAQDFRVKLESCEDVIADLRKQVQRWRGKLGEDVISLLSTPTDPGMPQVVVPIPQPIPVVYGEDLTFPSPCKACGALTVPRQDLAVWSHMGRELLGEGYLCWPARADSPVATPSFAPPADIPPQTGDVRVVPSPTQVLPFEPGLEPGQERAMQRLESIDDPDRNGAFGHPYQETGS